MIVKGPRMVCDRCDHYVIPSGAYWSTRMDGTDWLGSGQVCHVPGPTMTHTVNGSPHPPQAPEEES